MEEVIIPVALFSIAPLIVLAICVYRYKTKKSVLQVLETMTHKGDKITPEIVHAMGIRPRNQNADLRTGVILTALVLAFFILGIMTGIEDAMRALSGIAMFPFLIGAAYVGLWVFIGRKEPATFG